MSKLTKKQQRFVDEYLIDLNATQAAIRAGYSVNSANEQASRMLAKDNIHARVEEAMAERSRRTGINQDRVLRELARLAFVNPYEVINFDTASVKSGAVADDTAAILSVKVKTIPTEDGDIVEREIKMCDKIKALELLGKHMGIFTDKVDLNNGNITINVRLEDDDGGTAQR